MGVGCWRNPLLLLAALVLVARLGHFQRWEGFQETSTSMKNMNSTLKFFIETYNNSSNDTYLFQVDKLLRSRMQLTTGVEYMVTVKISRTKCKRNGTRNHSCPIQNKKNLKKFFLVITTCKLADMRNPLCLSAGAGGLLSCPDLIPMSCWAAGSRHSCSRSHVTGLGAPKSFICDFLVYTVPWMNYYQLWNNSCLEA